MYDLKWIRDTPDLLDEGLKRRNLEPISAKILELDKQHRAVQSELQDLQARRNEASKLIGVAKRNGEAADELMAEVATIKTGMAEREAADNVLAVQIQEILASIPNRPKDDVPVGQDEADNVLVRLGGEKPSLSFAAKQHFELGEQLEQMDFETAAKLSGARFVLLRGSVARLYRALSQFMLDLHVDEHGYTEVIPPVLVRDHVMYGTGQLPKFAEDSFRTEDGFWLIPTAEVPLTNTVAGDILNENDLPKRMTALTPCFRSEAGSAGRDTRGMLRQHQFDKVEMVSIVHPEKSDAELERMVGCAEDVLDKLGLHYRVVTLCTGDMGFGARKTYDIEVWLPGQDAYREISSCSTCGDFQARRMNGRFRPAEGKKPEFVHTLNGSGVAVGRCLIAVMENYQQEDGSIIVPEVLKPYMGGTDIIRPDA
ncbi:serine--tRNA ligase [Kiloniella laminariae]|uniref:serine--tRNA ligase n=1 Tax=Kiloniella laminariae TaxID=454162 RepID=UPI0003654F02|nr:serine--tRNA ligase [Kiloniella laminariae]